MENELVNCQISAKRRSRGARNSLQVSSLIRDRFTDDISLRHPDIKSQGVVTNEDWSDNDQNLECETDTKLCDRDDGDQNSELDDEIMYLYDLMDSMQVSFKAIFTEITYKRLEIEFEERFQRKPQKFDYYEVVKNLNLGKYGWDAWGEKIEAALAENMM